MPVEIEDARVQLEKQYIGFGPNSTSVKPVHIANGVFREILGEVYDTEFLNRMMYWQTKRGVVEKGHTSQEVFSRLQMEDLIDEEIKIQHVEDLRLILRKVLDVENAVYAYKFRWESYTAGYQGFVAADRISKNFGGEFFGAWAKRKVPSLLAYLEDRLKDSTDVVTLLSLPFLNTEEISVYTPDFDFDKVRFLSDNNGVSNNALWHGMAQAAETLTAHLNKHSNKLFGMRITILFASFFLIRYLASLESSFVPKTAGKLSPFLLDFSDDASSPIARASAASYIHVCQSIGRFYSWGFSKQLRRLFTKKEIRQADPPTYKKKALSGDARELWDLGLTEAQNVKDPFLTIGQCLYDILMQKAQGGNPVGYLRQLGHRSGLLWPPVNFQPTKRFALQQDMLEMLVRGAVKPGDVVELQELQRRLWERYGIIIGGRLEDEDCLVRSGVYQADSTALQENQKRFAERLSLLDFADTLADGILKVEI